MKSNKMFKIQNNSRVAKCYLCGSNITTDRKVGIGNKRSHLTCFARATQKQIANLEAWLKIHRYRLQRCKRYKDNMMLEEIAK